MGGYDDSHVGNSGQRHNGRFYDDVESNGTSGIGDGRSFNCLGRVLVNIVDQGPTATYDAQAGWKGKSCYVNAFLKEKSNSKNQVKTPVLLDTGAAFSTISKRTIDKMKRTNIRFTVEKSKRPTPTSASQHLMEVKGDAILTCSFKGLDGILDVQNIRFTIIEGLSCECLIGHEILSQLNFSADHDMVVLGRLRFPLISTSLILNITSIDESHRGNSLVVTKFKKQPQQHECTLENKMYIIESIQNDIETTEIEPTLISGSDLEGTLECSVENLEDYFTPSQMTVQQIDESIKIESSFTDNEINSLQDRGKLIDPSVINKIVDKIDLDDQSKTTFKELLEKYKHVFSTGDNDVGCYQGQEIHLDTIDDTPVYIPSRRIPYALKDTVRENIAEMVQNGIIERSNGAGYNSPIHMVKKKNGKFRMTVDFRAVNKKLRPNRFPIPRCREMFDRLRFSKYFSLLDLRAGYWNIKIQESSRDITTFNLEGKTYRWVKMPMGLSISGNIFQRIMMEIIGEDLNEGITVYIDDVLVYSKTLADHFILIEKVLNKFAKAGILMNPTKCEFGQTEVNYLGYTISEEGFRPQTHKCEAIKNFPIPATRTELKRFIGMCSFYSETVPNLQLELSPLHEIAGIAKFIWDEEKQMAFDRAKELLAESVTLSFPRMRSSDTMILTTDASDTGYGCVLSERTDDSQERPIGFTSGKFRGAQIRWKIADKEFYAMVQGFNHFYVYLYAKFFIYRTDNKVLSFLKTKSMSDPKAIPNWKVMRWLEYVTEFDFEIEHHDGNSACMLPADALSRTPPETKEIGSNVITTLQGIKKPFWVKYGVSTVEVNKAQQSDKQLIGLKGHWKQIGNRIKIIDDVMYVRFTDDRRHDTYKVIISDSMVTEIFDFYHFQEHFARERMMHKLRGKYYVFKLKDKLNAYLKACQECLAIKHHRTKKI